MWARASTLRLLESPQSPDTFSLYTLIRCRQGGGEGAHRHGAHIAAGELHSNRPAQTGCASQGWWSGKLRGSFEGPLSNVPHEGVSRACARTDRPTKRCRRGRWRPAPEAQVPARACTGKTEAGRAREDRGQHSARGSDLPSPGGLPKFRSNRLDRPEPSQHAPLLPATPTTRLGPSASRRPETRKSSARLRVVGAGS